jgi:hypothetical protein
VGCVCVCIHTQFFSIPVVLKIPAALDKRFLNWLGCSLVKVLASL